MNELELIVSLFPIVFMLHEFEEIIGFKTWVGKFTHHCPPPFTLK